MNSAVAVYDFGEQDEQPYLVMRLMTGGSLADRIQANLLPIQEIIPNHLAEAFDSDIHPSQQIQQRERIRIFF